MRLVRFSNEVLLRDRKRHTARGITSLAFPPPVLARGKGSPILGREYPCLGQGVPPVLVKGVPQVLAEG